MGDGGGLVRAGGSIAEGDEALLGQHLDHRDGARAERFEFAFGDAAGAVGAALAQGGQFDEDAAGEVALGVALELVGQDLVGVLLHGAFQPANGVIVVKGGRATRALFPQPVEDVFEQSEAAGFVADLFDHRPGETGIDGEAGELGGFADYVKKPCAGEAGEEVVLAEQFPDAFVAAAQGEEVDAEGDDDLQPGVRALGGAEDQVEKRGGVGILGEELFELVDEEQLAGAGRQGEGGEGVAEGFRAGVAGWRGEEAATGGDGFATLGDRGLRKKLGQGLGEGVERLVAGFEGGDAPFVVAGAAAVERGDEAGADEGGFAGAGVGDDGQEAVAAVEAFEHGGHVRVAPEEEVGVFGLESVQPAERRFVRGEDVDALGRGGEDGGRELLDDGAVGVAPVGQARRLVLAEEAGEGLFGSIAEQQRDELVLPVFRVADEGVAEFALYPAFDSGGADEDEEVGGGIEGLLEGGDPFLAGLESVEFQPDCKVGVADIAQVTRHGAGGVAVLRGVAEEDGGHGTERVSGRL